MWISFAFEVGEKKSLEKVDSYSISVFKRREISLEKKELSSQTILYSC